MTTTTGTATAVINVVGISEKINKRKYKEY